MKNPECSPFLDALSGHQHRFICALDPFTLEPDEILERLLYLQAAGATVAIVASTDDEGYENVVPPLLAYLRTRIQMKIIEHFRPHPEHGFRRADADSYILMTTVANSAMPLYSDLPELQSECRTHTTAPHRARDKLIASRALVFGHDEKSRRYVDAQYVPDDSVSILADYLEAATPAWDVYYLFSRSRKLKPQMIAATRAIVGPHIPIVVSGCIKTAEDIGVALQAGASCVAIGTLLEHGNWRERLDALIGYPDAVRTQA